MDPISETVSNNTQTLLGATSTQDGISEEFDSFIRLLTAQVQHQDPLSPLDSTQFVEQLATFSTLEQQVESNDTLSSIATMIGDLNSIVASEWLGQTVSVQSSWVPYTGEAIDFAIDAPGDVDRAVLTVRNSNGDALWTETLNPSALNHQWNGQTQSGGQVPFDSLNQFSIDLYRGADYAGSVAPRIITTVTGIGSENGELRLGTASHLTTDIANIRKVDE